MGYTGVIKFNKSTIFNEWKSNNTTYCMDYPKKYVFTKPCVVTIKAIQDTIGNLNHGVSGYGSIAFSIKCCMDIIQTLTMLLECSGWKSNRWNEDGTHNFVIKMQNHDDFGNTRDINFYLKDNVSDVREVSLWEQVSVSKDDIKDMNLKRIACINAITIYSVFGGLKDGRERYIALVDDIMKISTYNDVMDILAKVQQGYGEINQLYMERWKTANNLNKALFKAMQSIKAGNEVKVQYLNNILLIIDGDNIEKIYCNNSFMLCELFANANLHACDASIVINEKKEFENFISMFETIPSDDRNIDIESIIIRAYESLNDDEPFEFFMGGCF